MKEQRPVTWQVVMAAEDLWEGELTGVQLGGKQIVLLNVGGEIRAFEDRCPHLGSQLSEGDLDGCTLTCANHLWEFDALTGKGTNPGNCQLTVFDTRVREGQIEILAPGPEELRACDLPLGLARRCAPASGRRASKPWT